jgi:hypothetical protein
LQIYLPGNDLVPPPAKPAQATSTVLDQAKLDSLRIESGGWGSSFMVGEIRFGATYRDVVPAAPPSTPERTPSQTIKGCGRGRERKAHRGSERQQGGALEKGAAGRIGVHAG